MASTTRTRRTARSNLCQREGEEAGGTIVLQYLPHELVGQYFSEAVDPEPEVTA